MSTRTLLIFDIDGTLVYSERRDSRCFALTYERRYGRTFPSLDWEHYPHVTDTTILSTVIGEHFARRPEPAEMSAFEEEYLALLAERRRRDPAHSREVPGARAAVERLLADERYALGVATGGWRRPARLKLEHVGIPAGERLIEGADGHHTREAIIGALVAAARARHGAIGRLVYVGDAPWDVRTTRNLGIPFVGIRWQGDHEVLTAAGAGHVLTDYLDFAAFVAAVEGAGAPL